jgi:hypothetical protein
MQDKIVSAIRAGAYNVVAAECAGIYETTFYEWMRRGENATTGIYRDFYNAVKLAASEAEIRAVLTIQQCIKDGDWKAAMTYLERKYPDRWSRRERHEVSGPGGGPLEMRASLMHQLIREAESGRLEPEVVDEHLHIASMDDVAYIDDDEQHTD